MTSKNYPGRPEMVEINGARIRQIREEKGLTQLYVATAVEVTTDTVSRWENNRYPAIKKENALKLAEALETSLEDILDDNTEDAQSDQSPEEAVQDQPVEEIAKSTPAFSNSYLFAILLTAITLFAFAAGYFALKTTGNGPSATYIVERIVSPHFIPGKPLPVFIKVTIPEEVSVPFIVRENIPPSVSISAVDPPVSKKQNLDNRLQWLDKVQGEHIFFYIITPPATFQESIRFNGTYKTKDTNSDPLMITGNNISNPGVHHWADRDKNGRISDAEILLVYDLVEGGRDITFDIDLIEEIWLGEGYIWSKKKQAYTIVD
ncbi:MAG: helix-turn-helix domain-containing protein [Desulfobulbaceae bacterium]|nr:MAG: helix-turn-helix domain-containing protein [Desulfobulbaceae bacterium]